MLASAETGNQEKDYVPRHLIVARRRGTAVQVICFGARTRTFFFTHLTARPCHVLVVGENYCYITRTVITDNTDESETVGTCGGGGIGNGICNNGLCCSRFGFCGEGEEY